MTKKRLTISLLITASILYTSACAYLYFFQRSILYLPDTYLAEPSELNFPEATTLKIKTVDNVTLTAWYIAPKDNKPTLVYFHGNSSNLGKRVNKFRKFADNGFGMLALSYRGYGNSEGSPSEDGLYNDARAAINHLISKGLQPKDIILYGESLGSGVAIQMALENNFRAIVLEAPYDSIAARAVELYPLMPIKLLLKDKFLSIEKIGKLQTPLLFFHSKDDKVMPLSHGMTLFNAANEPKKIFVFEHAGHGGFDYQELSILILDFINN